MKGMMMSEKKAPGKPKASKRTLSRLYAVQALFQIEQTGASPSSIIREFIAHRLGQEIDDVQFLNADNALFAELVQGTFQDLEDIDNLIISVLNKDWTLDRIESVIRAILRLGVNELKNHLETPTLVIINEYLEITRAFCENNEEVAFVNGILDKIAKTVRQGLDPRLGAPS